MRAFVLVLVIALSGCLASPDGSPPVAPAAAPANTTPYGDATVEESDVETFPTTNGFVAEQTVTFRNGVGSATASEATFSTPAGGFIGRGEHAGAYTVSVLKRARAATAAQASDALDTILIHHDDNGGARLGLEVIVTFDPQVNPPGVLGRTAQIDAQLPTHLDNNLDATTGSGGIDVRGLVGGNLKAATGSGGVDVHDSAFGVAELDSGSGGLTLSNVRVPRLMADTGSGGIELEGSFDTIMANTGSGGIDGRVTAEATGTYELDAGSGGVDLMLDRASGQKFDIQAAAGSGGVDVILSDGENVEEPTDRTAHVRSTGFSSAAIQTTILANTGSGGVDIAD